MGDVHASANGFSGRRWVRNVPACMHKQVEVHLDGLLSLLSLLLIDWLATPCNQSAIGKSNRDSKYQRIHHRNGHISVFVHVKMPARVVRQGV